MLELAKDYVPLSDVTVHQKTPDSIDNKYKVALEYGLSNNIFNAKNKKNRLIKLLGAGRVEIGYPKYLAHIERLEKEFTSMCQVLDERIWGYKVFDKFSQNKGKPTRTLWYEFQKHGITTYKKMTKIHKAIKAFRALDKIHAKALAYIPLNRRVRLDEAFIKKHYWDKKMTTQMIADALLVPEIWIYKEITRLGMQKKKNGIKLRGRQGYVMPDEEKVKHHKQPHSRAVVQICPKTFKVLRLFNSTCAVERDGWSRENVRKAIKSVGLHDGFLWAYDGEEAQMIASAKAKGDLAKKLKIWENGQLQKEDIQKLYIDQNLDKYQVAKILNCHPSSVACVASRWGLLKRPNKLDKVELKRLYLDEGLQAKEIAPILGYTTKTISSYLSRLGIRKKDKGHL